jgi:hypothetical protein
MNGEGFTNAHFAWQLCKNGGGAVDKFSVFWENSTLHVDFHRTHAAFAATDTGIEIAIANAEIREAEAGVYLLLLNAFHHILEFKQGSVGENFTQKCEKLIAA